MQGVLIKKGFALMLSIMLLVILSVMSTAVLLNIMKEKETYIDAYSKTTLMQIANAGLNEVIYRMNKYPNDSLYIGDFNENNHDWQTVILFNNINYKKENIYYKKSILMDIENYNRILDFNYTTKHYIKNKSLTISYKKVNDSIYFYNTQKDIIELLPYSYLSIFPPIYTVNIFAKNKIFAKKYIADIYNKGNERKILASVICQAIQCKNGEINISSYNYGPEMDYNFNFRFNKNYENEEYDVKYIPSIASIFPIKENNNIHYDNENILVSQIPDFSTLYNRNINTINFRDFEIGKNDTVNYNYFIISKKEIELNFDTYTKGFIYTKNDLIINGNFALFHKGLMYINGDLIIDNNASLYIIGSLIVKGHIICRGNLNVVFSSPYISSYHYINKYKLLKWE